MKLVWLSLGSNAGTRSAVLRGALRQLPRVLDGRVLATSFLYETAGVGMQAGSEAGSFLNLCLRATTRLTPEALIDRVKELEEAFGRDVQRSRDEASGLCLDRTLDVDILLYEDLTNFESVSPKNRKIIIPHPRLKERDFVLQPLNDISSDYVFGDDNRSVVELLNNVEKLSNPIKVMVFSNPHIKRKKTIEKILNLNSKDAIYIMGIVNMTPDSFSHSEKNEDEKLPILDKIRQMVRDGAKIIDIGGESTRPGAKTITEEEEIERIMPILKSIQEDDEIYNNVIISVDTRKAKVAKAAIMEGGAEMINDVSGGMFDPNMLSLASELQVPICLMHMRGNPDDMVKRTKYGESKAHVINEIEEVMKDIIETKAIFENNIPRFDVIMDPGIGFAKDADQNFLILQSIPRFREFFQGIPILIGTSRKRFLDIHKQTPLPKDRDHTTCVTTISALIGGASFVRVHNVKQNKEAIDIWKNIYSN